MRREKRVCFLIVIFLLPVLFTYPADTVSQAMQHFREGNFSEAAEQFEKAVSVGTAGPFEQTLLGLCYIELGNFEGARFVLTRAVEQDPFLVLSHIAFGKLEFAAGNYADAYKRFSRARELDPGSEDARRGMAASLVNRGRELCRQGDIEEGRTQFMNALEVIPGYIPALQNCAVLEIEQGNYQKARRTLEQALEHAPRNIALLMLLVSVFEATGNTTKMEETLQRTVALDPPLPEPYAKLGLILLQKTENGESSSIQRVETLFEKAEALGTEEPAIYLWLAERQRSIPLTHLAVGNAVRKAGRIRLQAAQSLRGREDDQLDAETVSALKGMSDRLEHPLAILTESIELLRTLHNGTEDFEEDLAMLLDWYPHSVELKEAAGSFYESEERWGDARRMWTKVLEMDAMSYPAQYGMAKALENVGEFDQAALFYRRALGTDSSDKPLYEGLFRVYTAMGKREELLSILERHAILDSRNPLLFEYLSNLEAHMGLQERAEKHRKRADYLHNLFAESTADENN